MKKIIFFFSLAVTILLTGCSDTSKETSTPTSTPAETEIQATSAEEDNAPMPPKDATEEMSETPSQDASSEQIIEEVDTLMNDLDNI